MSYSGQFQVKGFMEENWGQANIPATGSEYMFVSGLSGYTHYYVMKYDGRVSELVFTFDNTDNHYDTWVNSGSGTIQLNVYVNDTIKYTGIAYNSTQFEAAKIATSNANAKIIIIPLEIPTLRGDIISVEYESVGFSPAGVAEISANVTFEIV